MDLSIIIVSWNVREKLKKNLEAIFQSNGIFDFEVFVVDNNSFDGSAEMVKNEFSQVKLIINKNNLGFARANNQAIKKAKGEFILLLNPDMKVMNNTLVNIVNWMKKNELVGVAGCHLINEAGETIPHVRKFPTVWDQLAIVLKLPHLFPFLLNGYLRKHFDYTKETEVNSIRGSFFMIRKEVIEKVGLLDERYFLWFEEVDFCKTVKKVGWKIMYTPEIKCIDYFGQSFFQVSRGKTQKYFRASMLKYFKKWHPTWQYWILKLAWPIGIFISRLGSLCKIKSKIKT